MRIQKQSSRKYKGRSYFKYAVNLPKGAIERSQIALDDDLDVTAEKGEILLKKRSTKSQEFDGVRAKMYAQALQKFPEARKEDLELMRNRLQPKAGERILEIGAGSGFFSRHIAPSLESAGRLIVADPSLDQLKTVKNINANNIDVIQFVQFGSPTVDLEKEKVDAIWSFGAFHHVNQKQKSFENMARVLKKGGRIVISDVFSGSALAKHFDTQVARYCVSGHEVSFLSKEYATALCRNAGFEDPTFFTENQKWWFDRKKDIGEFIYLLHAMTGTSQRDCLKGCEDILGVGKQDGEYFLNWPMTTMITRLAS